MRSLPLGPSEDPVVSHNEPFLPWLSGYPAVALGVLAGYLFRIGANSVTKIPPHFPSSTLGFVVSVSTEIDEVSAERPGWVSLILGDSTEFSFIVVTKNHYTDCSSGAPPQSAA